MPRRAGTADRKTRAIVDDLRTARMNTAADLIERSVSETLTYFPDIHWQQIRTNNPLERIMERFVGGIVGASPTASLPQPRGRTTCQVLHEHATALSAAVHANRSCR